MKEPTSLIPPEHHQIRVIHRSPHLTTNVMVMWAGSAPPRLRMPGYIYLDVPAPPADDKHIALGRFMDSWSKLEGQLHQRVQELLLTAHQGTARTVASSLSGRSLIEMVKVLAFLHLPDQERVSYEVLLERFRKLNTKRNTVAHGRWVLEIVVSANKSGPPTASATEVRELPPVLDDDYEKLTKLSEQRVRSKYLLSVAQIEEAEAEIAKLYNAFARYHAERPFLRRSVISEPI